MMKICKRKNSASKNMEFYLNPPEYIPECDLTCYEVMKTTKYTYGNIF